MLLELVDRALTTPYVIRHRISSGHEIFAPHLGAVTGPPSAAHAALAVN